MGQMVDFSQVAAKMKKRRERGKTIMVTVQIQMESSLVADLEVLEQRLCYLWDSCARETALFNLLLLREAQASTWELKSLKVADVCKD
jgi:hypothetical protein